MRLGDEPAALVVIPGLADAIVPATVLPRLAALVYRAYSRVYKVYILSRRRGLPQGYTTRDMARDYAGAIERIGPPVDLLGLSLGSLIAQRLAADYPALVRTVVLAQAGARSTPRGERHISRWIEWARKGKWPRVYRDIVETTLSGPSRPLLSAIAPLAIGTPGRPTDFIVSAEAALAHDSRDRLSSITAQTLVIGGERDALVPPERYKELASLIPFATLHLIRGGSHAVDAQRKIHFDHTVLWFLQLRRAQW